MKTKATTNLSLSWLGGSWLEPHLLRRRFLKIIAERLDYLWLLGYGLDAIRHPAYFSVGR